MGLIMSASQTSFNYVALRETDSTYYGANVNNSSGAVTFTDVSTDKPSNGTIYKILAQE